MLHRIVLLAWGFVALTIAVMNPPFLQAAGAQPCHAHCTNVCGTKSGGTARRFAVCMERCPPMCAAKRAAKRRGGMSVAGKRRGP